MRLGLAAAAAYLVFGGRKGDVSDSVSISSGKDFFRLAQGDPRWASMPVGFSSEPSSKVGCFFTTLVAARNMLKSGELLPPAAMEILKKANAFSGALLVLPTAAAALGVSAPESERIRAGVGTDEQMRAKADDILRRGGLVIFNVGYGNKTPRHFILCNRRGPNGYECMDVGGPSSALMNISASSLSGVRNSSRTYVVVGVAGVFAR